MPGAAVRGAGGRGAHCGPLPATQAGPRWPISNWTHFFLDSNGVQRVYIVELEKSDFMLVTPNMLGLVWAGGAWRGLLVAALHCSCFQLREVLIVEQKIFGGGMICFDGGVGNVETFPDEKYPNGGAGKTDP